MKMKRDKLVDSGSSTSRAIVFFKNWVIPFGIPLYALTDNRLLFVSKLFATETAGLGTKHLTMIAYHWQTEGQVGKFNTTIVAHL